MPERITIARAWRPIADLVPHRRTDLVFGLARGQIAYDEATFDDAHPETDAPFGDDL